MPDDGGNREEEMKKVEKWKRCLGNNKRSYTLCSLQIKLLSSVLINFQFSRLEIEIIIDAGNEIHNSEAGSTIMFVGN